MRGRERGCRWVAASVAIYRVLLWAYPAPFRREWCADMAQLFGDCCRDGYRVGGPAGLARVWLVALNDLARSVPRERLSRLRRPGRWSRRCGRNRYTRLALQALAARPGGRMARGAPGDALAPLFHLRRLKHLLRRRGSQRPVPPSSRNDVDRFSDFTERARNVLAQAQEAAQRFSHNAIGTEHLLLGLLRDPDSLAARVLGDLGVSLEDARRAVELIIGRGDRVILGEIGMTPRAKLVIELARAEARQMGHHYIGTEHLLLGLLREGEGIAAGVLARLGVSLERARAQTLQRLRDS